MCMVYWDMIYSYKLNCTLDAYLVALSQEENASGRFLKSHSQQDKTRAGKMMAAVGKSLSFSSQQRYLIFLIVFTNIHS